MAETQRRRVRLALLGFVIVVLAACGGTSAGLGPGGGATSGGGAAGRPAGGTQPGGGTVVGGDGAEPGGAAASPAASGAPGGEQQRDGALVVKTGTLELEVDDLDAVGVRARTIVVGAGGYISGSDEARNEDRQVASITYRIPAERWNEVLARLRGLAKNVVAERTNAVEVTGQVVDLAARIRNLRTTESAVQGIMARAEKIEDVLEVHARLTDIRGQIEQLTAQKQHLEDEAAYGTLTVTYSVPVPTVAVTEVKEGWDPAREFDRAAAQTIALGQGLVTLAIWLGVVVVPLLTVLGVFSAIAYLVARRVRRLAPDERSAASRPGA